MSRLAELGDPLASGRIAEVYRWDAGRVVKLFRAGASPASVEAEQRNMIQVARLGLPMPTPGKIVMVAGRIGLVMEEIAGVTMMDLIIQQPSQLASFARLLADRHICLHRVRAPDGLHPLHALLQGKIERSAHVTRAERNAVLGALADMPSGTMLCHGDFHPGNLLMTSHGPIIIDWPDAASGPPMADVARTSLLFAGHIALSAGNPDAQAPMERYRDIYLECRLAAPDGDREEVQRWRPILAAARLSEGIDEQQDWLRQQVRRVL